MPGNSTQGAATWFVGAIYVTCFYVMSFGPACRLVNRDVLPVRPTGTIYAPMILLAFDGPPAVRNSLVWYARVAGGEQALWDMKYH